MKSALTFALVCLSVLFTFADTPPPPLSDKAKSLFDGKTLDGWESPAPELWRVQDNCLTGGDGKIKIPYNDFLCTKASYSNFILHLKIKLTGDPKTGFINSGIQIRTRRNPTGHEVCGYQCDYGEPSWYASIYDEGRRNKLMMKSNMDTLRSVIHLWDWNDYVMKADGPRIQTWINGVQGVDYVEAEHDIASDGIIGIQLHGGGNTVVQVKDIFIEELPPTPNAPTWESLGGVDGQRAKLKPGTPTGATTAPSTSSATAGLVLAPGVISIEPLGQDGKALNLGFETGTLKDWTAEGNAWEGQPVKGDAIIKRHRGQSNHVGDYWVGGYEKLGDKGTGRLTSASFEVTHPWASFLIGGGKDPKQTRVEIVEESTGKVIHTASGFDVENMRREVVDLRAYAGKRIFIRLVDESTAGWGHVNFDDFVFHDKEPPLVAATVAKGTAAVAGGAEDRATRQKESPVLRQLQPNPAKPTAVANAAAQSVVAGMMLTPGFQAQLVAAEPEVRQPIAFAIDERGRLWVAEAYSYPNKQPEGQGKDRILIFEDVDGDGTFKKRTVFYEGLNLVSGIEVGFGGVWIGAAPELIFIPKDANDHAGKPQVLLDGFGYQDTHETINSFCWGPDGWLYGNQGVFNHALIGKPGTPENERTELRSGVWRYHPIRHQFEIFAHGGSNQWGLDYNSNGHLFMTHCRSFWGGGGTTYVIRNGHFWNQANAHYAPFISNSAPDFAPQLKNFLPAASKYDDGEGGAGKPGSGAIYGGHAHAGTMVYLGDNWPDSYRDHLFTNNLFGHQMNHQVNIRRGSAYETFPEGFDLLCAPAPDYMAVDLQTGPDGAVYVIDWCDLQHCHNPDPTKWDRTNGRIYRISWAQTYHPVKVDLGLKTDLELAQLHTHHNDWYSRQARGLLQERAAQRPIDPQAIAALQQQAAGTEVAQVLRALFTLHVIGALDSAQLTKFTQNPSDIVRSWAVQLATEKTRRPLLGPDVLLHLAKEDPSPTVRLALASALPTLGTPLIWDLATALASHAEDKDDRFLPKMIWTGLAPVVAHDYLRALALADHTALPSLADSIRWFVGREPRGRDLLVFQLASQPEDVAARSLRIFAFAMKDEASSPKPAPWPAAYARFAKSSNPAVVHDADQLAALFGDKEVLAKMRGILADETRPQAERQSAFDLLKRANDPEATPVFARLLDAPAFRAAVIPLLSRSTDPATAQALIQRFEKFDPSERNAALGTLTSRKALAMPLLQAVQNGVFDRKYLSALQVRQLRDLHDAEVDRLADQTLGKVNESSAAMKETIARLEKVYAAAPLWAFNAESGHQTFNQVCAVCHALNGVGGKLGPDLAESWRNGVNYFVENIVDPNAVVGENYQLHVITKKDGSVVSGILDQETNTAITLRTVTEPIIVAKADVKEHQKLAQSMMPPGLLEALPEPKVIELLKFLTSKH
ncbi:MAG TPA: PVC-type heme-binding CxxCH protein [Chthoniobacter sp.]|jgi:putative membrane-bound dehydrogenase-like protein